MQTDDKVLLTWQLVLDDHHWFELVCGVSGQEQGQLCLFAVWHNAAEVLQMDMGMR